MIRSRMLPLVVVAVLPFLFVNSAVAWVASGTPTEAATWTQWLSLVLSRGIYFVLAFLIILCVIYTVLKNKLGLNQMSDVEVALDPSNWLMTLWKTAGCDKFTGCQASTFKKYGFAGMLGSPLGPESEFGSSESDTALKEKLRSAETEVSALRGELETSHRSRLDLESSLELLDKDKMTVEEKLELERVNGIFEMEKLKKENASTNRELQRVIQEKQELNKEVESLQREARIAESALRDQQSLQARLEDAKREVEALKAQMVALQAEKEMAVSMVSDIMVKASKRTSHPHHLEPSLSTALPFHTDVLMMIDQVGDTHSTEFEYDRNSCQESSVDQVKMDGGEGEMWVRRRRKKSRTAAEGEDDREDEDDDEGDDHFDEEPTKRGHVDDEDDEDTDKEKTEDEESGNKTPVDDDSGEPRLVTGSTAFRKFLESNFT